MKTQDKNRKLLRKFLMGFSLTSVAFAFQACYGTPEDFGMDIKLSGTVRSKTTNQPIKGIKVSVGKYHYDITDENGKFDFYTHIDFAPYDDATSQYRPDSIPVIFADIDSIENGYFRDKEVAINHSGQNAVKINVELEEKND